MFSVGEMCALLAPMCWAVAMVLYRIAGANASPAAMNLFKNVLATVLLSATLLVLGVSLPHDRSPEDWVRLVVSGLLGLAIADPLVFEGLRRVGAARVAVMDTVYAPIVVFLSWLVLHEVLSPDFLIGAGGVVVGITLANVDPAALRGRVPVSGLLYAVAGIACTAVGVVIAKPVLAHSDLVEVTWTRLVVGVVGQCGYLLARGRLGEVAGIFRPARVWKTLIPAAIMGTYVSLLLWLGGFKWADASVAAVLNQMATVYMLVLARVFLGERLRGRQLVGALVAAGGALFIVLRR